MQFTNLIMTLLSLLCCTTLAHGRRADGVAFDTIRDVHLCKEYFIGSPADCEALRRKVRAVRRDAAPTLELGDPSRPPMLFFHGWPSTSAMWANQFKSFCYDEDASYFCIAPSWIDFHPDLPAADPTSHRLITQVCDFLHGPPDCPPGRLPPYLT